MTTHLRHEKEIECVSVNAYERDTLYAYNLYKIEVF